MNKFNVPNFLSLLVSLVILTACQPFGDNELKEKQDSFVVQFSSPTYASPILQFFTSGVPTLPATVTLDDCSISPSLPAGLSIDPATCEISGTPTTAVTGNYTITASSSGIVGKVDLLLNFLQVIPIISYSAGSFQFNLNVASTTGVPTNAGGTISNCLVTPALPAGLTINSTTCAISGTASVVSSNTVYDITASNSAGNAVVSSITIGVLNVAPSITYSSANYNFNLNAVSTTGVLTNVGGAITGCGVTPALPTGLAINATTCVISGTPTVVTSTASYTITPSNTIGSGTARVINITVQNVAPSIAFSNGSYIFNVNGAGATTGIPTNTGGDITGCIVTPTLPTGLAINTSTCTISGTPTVVTAAANYTITPSNTIGSGTARVINITVPNVAPSIAYSSATYSFDLYATGSTTGIPTNTGGAITACGITPNLPAGLIISATTCAISGTPTVVTAAANYTITPSNTAGSGTARVISLAIANIAPSIAYSSASYSFNLNASGSTTGTPTNVGGAITACGITPILPTGLSISATTCEISGTPTVAAPAADYTITPSNLIGSGTARVINLTIVPPSLVTSGAYAIYDANSTVSYPAAGAWNDISGNNRHASLTGAWMASGLTTLGGRSVVMNDTSDTIFSGEMPWLDTTYSIQTWLKFYGFNNLESNIFSAGGGYINASYPSVSAYGQVVIPTVQVGTWYNIAITVSGTSVSVYLNGSLFGTSTNGSAVSLGIFRLGGDQYSGHFLNVGDLLIYDKTLTAAEVLQNYQNKSTTYISTPPTPGVSTQSYAANYVCGNGPMGRTIYTPEPITTGTTLYLDSQLTIRSGNSISIDGTDYVVSGNGVVQPGTPYCD